MTMDWEEFLDPYIQAVGELKIKLRGIRKQFRKQNRHSPIEFVTGRVKSVASIEEKIALRGLSVENLAQDMQDIAGLRVMVQFVDDVDEVLALLRHRSDMTIVSERDYIRNRNIRVIALIMLLSLIPLIPLMVVRRFLQRFRLGLWP